MVTWAEKEKMAKATKTTFDDEQIVEWKKSHHYLTLSDGTEIAFSFSMWTKEMFEKIVAQAKLYDVEIAKYEAAEKGIGNVANIDWSISMVMFLLYPIRKNR